MIVALDIGNSNIVVGIINNGVVVHSARIATAKNDTSFNYMLRFRKMLNTFRVRPTDIEGCILASVVPELTSQVSEAISKITGHEALVLGRKNINIDIHLSVDNPSALGHDRIADAVGAINLFNTPIIVIDMGTATTVNVVDKDQHFIGGMIIPGVKTSLDSLCGNASQLSMIRLEAPASIIGRNTIECMQSGIVYGYASMIDGIIERITNELGYECNVIATGGLSSTIIPHCKSKIAHEPHLLLKGLYHIYNDTTT